MSPEIVMARAPSTAPTIRRLARSGVTTVVGNRWFECC